MNKYYIFIMGLTMMLALGSCSNDETTSFTTQEQEPVGRVTFTLGSSAKTRAQAATTSLDYEKNIQNCYVVAYKNNKLTKTIKATATATANGFTADLAASGVLDIYFIANVEEGSGKLSDDILALAVGSQSSALEALTATQTPGAYQTTATDGFFPMIGKVSATINTQDAGGTDIGSVTVKRLAARIDIDDVMPTGFTISGVTVNSRYDQSLLVRNVGNTAMTDLGSVSNGNDYTFTTLPYQGHIYLYEDMSASTELVLHGTYNGHTINPVVRFVDNSGATPVDIPVVRNHIYNVTLSGESLTETLQNVSATITVVDWTTGEQIAKSTTAITDRTTVPTVAFSSISNSNCTDDGYGNLTSTDAAAISFTATVTTTGSTTSKLVCKIPDDGIGILITPGTTTYNLDGTTTQTFTVSIDANATGAVRTITFRAENLLNRDAYKEFTVVQAAS